MNYDIGDTINMPEPPVDTVLESTGPYGTFTIRRTYKGWKIDDKGKRNRFCWRAVICAWGPGAGQVLTVVKVAKKAKKP